MTARNQPHKYRCETCSNEVCPYYIVKTEIGRSRHWQTGKERRLKRVEFTPASFTEECGCASHSDAGKAEQQIADVIAELEKRESEAECGLTLTDYHKIVSMLHELALLRGKEE